MSVAIGYFVFVYRMFRGKVRLDEGGEHGYKKRAHAPTAASAVVGNCVCCQASKPPITLVTL